MPEGERYYPPEALTPIPESSEDGKPVVEEQEGESAAAIPRLETPTSLETTHQPPEDDRPFPEQQWDEESKREAMVAKFTRGLVELYDLLPRTGKVSEDEIIDLIDHTELRELWPRPRKNLAHAIVTEHLHEGKKAAFVFKGLDLLQLIIAVEAGKLAGDEWLDQQLASRGDEKSSAQPPGA